MLGSRTLQAVYLGAEPFEKDGTFGLLLCFRPLRARIDADRIEDPAELGPELTIPAVAGIGKVLRILRAAKIAAPEDGVSLLGDRARIERLLARAEGTRLVLTLLRRTRVRYVAWTEAGVETVEDVADVIEGEDETLVLRRGERLPVRFRREELSRGQTEREAWYQVLEIDRI